MTVVDKERGIIMRRIPYCSLLFFFVAMTIGCASLASPGSIFYHEPHALTRKDANRVHPHSRHKDTHIRLGTEESRSINRLYGKDISQEGDSIVYYKARYMKPLYPRTKGNIFLVTVMGETNEPLIFLVCITRGKVDEVVLKNNPIVNGKPLVSHEFLQQFIEHSLGHSCEIVKDPSDLLSLHQKIFRISDYPKTSREAANAIRKILVWAKVLRID
ncbi:MAG: hypothetical protein ACE5GK_12270 [Nitrospiria bacterium]